VDGIRDVFTVNRDKGVEPTNGVDLGNNSLQYNLTMPASLELNTSTVQCIAFSGSMEDTSNIVYLLVQGLLTNIRSPQLIQINTSTLLLSYQPPPSIQGVPITYTIEVTGEYSINITSLDHYLHLGDHCQPHDIIISPWNAVGIGNTTDISNVILYNSPQVVLLTVDDNFNNNGSSLLFVMTFQINSSCVGTIPKSMMLMINCSTVNDNCMEASLGPCLMYNDTNRTDCDGVVTITDGDIVMVNISHILSYGSRYSIKVLFYTLNSLNPTSFSFNINTHHVIDANVLVSTNDIVCVQCTLKKGVPPTAGCYVLFNNIHDTDITRGLEIKRSPSSSMDDIHDCISDLSDGVYSISIKDRKDDDDSNVVLTLDRLVTISHPMVAVPSTSYSDLSSSVIPTTGDSYANSIDITPVLIAVGSIVLISFILVVVIVLLMIYLMKARRKANKLREVNEIMMRKEQSDNVVRFELSTQLPYTVQSSVQSPVSVHLVEPMYANDRPTTVPVYQCPAYEQLPLSLPPR
jgi:hypothetical protein